MENEKRPLSEGEADASYDPAKCPECDSMNTVKNGSNANGKPKRQCGDCGRQFVLNPQKGEISLEKKAGIDKLLLEKIPLAGIARVEGVSKSRLQNYVTEKYGNIEQKLDVKKKAAGPPTIQCDEMWSFVGRKKDKFWIWLAIDVDSREIVGVFVGTRSRSGARGLWNSPPPVYRQCAKCYTDFWKAYNMVFPSARHKAVGKETGKTNATYRFNCTMRQRISRLVRKTLSFSKKIENHIGAIWYFIHHYNAVLA